MKHFSALLVALLAFLAFSATSAKAIDVILDIAVVNNGVNTTFTIASTGVNNQLFSEAVGSIGDGVSLYDLFAEGGIGLSTFTGSYNSGSYFNGPTANPTGNLIAEGGDAYFNAVYGNSFYNQADEQNLNLFAVGSGTVPGVDSSVPGAIVGDGGSETFYPHRVAFYGSMTWTISDSIDYQLADYFLPPLGDTGPVVTGFSGSDAGTYSGSGEIGASAVRDDSPLNTVPGIVLGYWQVVSYEDLPSPEAESAPEPRSWIFAGVVLLAVFGFRRRLVSGGVSA